MLLANGNAAEISGFWHRLAVRVLFEQTIEMPYGHFVFLLIEAHLGNAEMQRRQKILQCQKSYRTLELVFFLDVHSLKTNDRRCRRLEGVVLLEHHFVMDTHTKRDEILVNEFYYLMMYIRNHIHLLAADSLGIEHIEK